jgi:hypothetical protein
MPLPSSGEIKVSQINTELGRTSNTANSNFAGGSTPQTGSLFKLGEAGGVNQTAPHKMSEWHGYNAVHLVYQSSITKGPDYPTYSSNTNLWSINPSSNEGTDCSDTISLSASPSNISVGAAGHYMIFEIQDLNGSNYTDAFNLYFYGTISSNDGIGVVTATGYLDNLGFLRYSQIRPIVGHGENLTGDTASVSFNAGTLSSPNVYLLFYMGGDDETNSANVSFYDINTRENCPV